MQISTLIMFHYTGGYSALFYKLPGLNFHVKVLTSIRTLMCFKEDENNQ